MVWVAARALVVWLCDVLSSDRAGPAGNRKQGRIRSEIGPTCLNLHPKYLGIGPGVAGTHARFISDLMIARPDVFRIQFESWLCLT